MLPKQLPPPRRLRRHNHPAVVIVMDLDPPTATTGLAQTRFDVITLFPELFASFLSQSLLHKAIQKRVLDVHLWNLRDWSTNKHHRIDDRPYGGGPGMLISVEPVVHCVEAVQGKAEEMGKLILLSPSGKMLDQSMVHDLAQHQRLILLCGRYEGFDDRIREILQPQEISIGNYICNGGEVPAMVLIETIMRLIPGVLGDAESAQDDSHNKPGRLEFPQYTRPPHFRGHDVPEVLMSGNHQQIALWREEESRKRSMKTPNGIS